MLKPDPNKTNWPVIALCIALLPIPTAFLGYLNGHLMAGGITAGIEYAIALGIVVWDCWVNPVK